MEDNKIRYLNCEECNNNTFFLRKKGKKIEVICIKCLDNTGLDDAKSEDNKSAEGEVDK